MSIKAWKLLSKYLQSRQRMSSAPLPSAEGAQNCSALLELCAENASDSPSGEEGLVEILLLLSHSPVGPKVRHRLVWLKETAMSCHLLCRADGKACSDVLWKHFHMPVSFFQAVLLEYFCYFNNDKCFP